MTEILRENRSERPRQPAYCTHNIVVVGPGGESIHVWANCIEAAEQFAQNLPEGYRSSAVYEIGREDKALGKTYALNLGLGAMNRIY